MITTGVPASIALTEWLAKYASEHLAWFDRNSPEHLNIQSFLDQKTTEVPNDFLRFLGVALTLFDGGVFTANVRSVYASEKSLSLTWANGIVHSFGIEGWDRNDRLALKYIVKRCLNIQFDNGHDIISPIFKLLCHHEQALSQQLSDGFLTIVGPELEFNEMTFLVLSCLSNQQLETFYINVADVIPNEFHFEGLDQSMSAHSFFKRPVTEDILVLDKVKMHYNLLFHVPDDLPFIHDLRQETQQFLTASLQNSANIATVKAQLDQVKHQQLAPRLQLISAVLGAFKWPV